MCTLTFFMFLINMLVDNSYVFMVPCILQISGKTITTSTYLFWVHKRFCSLKPCRLFINITSYCGILLLIDLWAIFVNTTRGDSYDQSIVMLSLSRGYPTNTL